MIGLLLACILAGCLVGALAAVLGWSNLRMIAVSVVVGLVLVVLWLAAAG